MTRPTRRVRSDLRRAVAVGTVVAGSLGLAACSSNSGQAEAQLACRSIDQSVALYQRSQHAASAAQSATEAASALDELRTDALPLASQAAGNNPEWQALATDLEESSRVPEGDLITSMEQQCQLVNNTIPIPSSGNQGPGGGSATTVRPGGGSATTVRPGGGSATTVGPGVATSGT